LERVRRDEENRRREDERRQQEIERERRDEASRAQQERLIETLRDNRHRPPEPSPTVTSFDLPRMREDDELEEFIPVFEASLRVNNVPNPLWKQKLLTHLPLKSLVKVEEALQIEGSTYEDMVGALRGVWLCPFAQLPRTCVPVRGANFGN